MENVSSVGSRTTTQYTPPMVVRVPTSLPQTENIIVLGDSSSTEGPSCIMTLFAGIARFFSWFFCCLTTKSAPITLKDRTLAKVKEMAAEQGKKHLYVRIERNRSIFQLFGKNFEEIAIDPELNSPLEESSAISIYAIFPKAVGQSKTFTVWRWSTDSNQDSSNEFKLDDPEFMKLLKFLYPAVVPRLFLQSLESLFDKDINPATAAKGKKEELSLNDRTIEKLKDMIRSNHEHHVYMRLQRKDNSVHLISFNDLCTTSEMIKTRLDKACQFTSEAEEPFGISLFVISAENPEEQRSKKVVMRVWTSYMDKENSPETIALDNPNLIVNLSSQLRIEKTQIKTDLDELFRQESSE